MEIKVNSVRDQVYERMHEMILDGALLPGARLDLNQLVAMFGVSKTPINEAVQKLIQDRLLHVRPRSGTFVSVLNLDEIDMTFDFRIALEIGAADRIVARLTDASLADIRDAQARMRELVSAIDPESSRDFLRLDAEFHDRIIAAAGNELLLEHYRQVNTLSAVARARGRFAPATFEAAMADHEAILDALEARDRDGFRAACQVHVDRAKLRLRAALAAHDTAAAAGAGPEPVSPTR
ncbi:MAG: GntR family transcriptional regulator [Rubellimicrobium sp.]|nr:GntR family transcriptional regulator [Rubellimicrobium sp.]